MEVLVFQLVILAIMLVVGSFGNKARINTAIVLAVFTFVMVFMSWLIVLQFITILIGFIISQSLANPNSEDGSYSLMGCITITIIIVVIGTIINNYDNSDKVETLDNNSKESASQKKDFDNKEHVYDSLIPAQRVYSYEDTIKVDTVYTIDEYDDSDDYMFKDQDAY